MSMKLRAVLLAGGCLVATPAHAEAMADAQPEREYIPPVIIVTGTADGYHVGDGSTATKTPTPLVDVPQTVNFITEDQLEDQSVRQLNEALRYVPGVSLETGEGHRDEVFIRGQESTASFYIDGLRDDAQYYRSLYNIERVEVLKGANALIFGRGVGGGAINRVAKRAETGSTFAKGEASADTFGAFALLGDANLPVGDGIAVRLNTTYEEFDNHRDVYEGRFIGVSPTVTAELGPRTTLIASYTYDDDRRVTDRGIPALGTAPLPGYDETFFGDPDFNRSEAQVHIGRLRVEHEFSPELTANATLQYADYDKLYANIVPSGTDGSTVTLGGYQDAQQRQNWIGQANLVWDTQLSSALASTLLLGMEAMRQDSATQRASVRFTRAVDPADPAALRPNQTSLDRRVTIPPFVLDAPSSSRQSDLETLSFYIQEQLAIGEHIELVAGLRWDRFDLKSDDLLAGTAGDRVDEKLSPRLGLIVKPADDLSLYASYATSFLPQAGDQFLILAPGDTGLEPQKFINYEIGAKWAPGGKLLLGAALFRLERSNIKAPSPTDPTLTVLAGESRVEGFEISAAGEITPYWKANVGYTYLDGELLNTNAFGSAGKRLEQLPRHSISAWNRVDVSQQLGFGLGVIHQSDQFASFGNTVVLPAYWRVDAAAFYTVSDRLSFQLNVENLFDENYYASAHGDNNIQPGKPLSARVGVRFEL